MTAPPWPLELPCPCRQVTLHPASSIRPGDRARCGTCRRTVLFHAGSLCLADADHSDVRRDREERGLRF
ncbi:hypothetical protein [uncultured Deinococcus sp.]|uniref:hypothetical protein n=1 Tax=uncultured Deinococcus sp. TaxID=158789 RepID=UPI0025D5AE8F|nr:hypothetical protein [uncultured Deinococcus sp.]